VNRQEYYESLKRLAREKRTEYDVRTNAFGLREARAIYRAEKIDIDNARGKLRKVRAAYFLIDGKSHVLLNSNLQPVEPRLFSLCHELKHHWADLQIFDADHVFGCLEYLSYNKVPPIEIGAEVFAAEFIFPEEEFKDWIAKTIPPGQCTKEDVVTLRRASPAKISYEFIVKRLTHLGIVQPGQFQAVHFRKLEEQLYGTPFYKEKWFKDYRQRKRI
jgi:Zn-dependent peptidase ImmA (M78 family)